MTQRTVGLYSALSSPQVYRFIQRAIRARQLRREVLDYLGARPGDRLLDIGCGLGDISADLPGVDYIGFDLNERYINYARARYGAHGSFFVGDVTRVDPRDLGTFDLVHVFGVLHHLDDDGVLRLCELAANVLNPSGRLVTVDGCFDESQSSVARYIVAKDRGQVIRTSDGYRTLAEKHFGRVTTHLHHDLYRIPYTLAILEASGPRATDIENRATEPA